MIFPSPEAMSSTAGQAESFAPLTLFLQKTLPRVVQKAVHPDCRLMFPFPRTPPLLSSQALAGQTALRVLVPLLSFFFSNLPHSKGLA